MQTTVICETEARTYVGGTIHDCCERFGQWYFLENEGRTSVEVYAERDGVKYGPLVCRKEVTIAIEGLRGGQ